jgi:hypothetical protein
VTLGIRRTIKVAGSPSGIVIARDLVWVSID